VTAPRREISCGPKKTPAGVAGVEGRIEQQRLRYYFFFFAFFLAGFFLAMRQCRKYFARLHENSSSRAKKFSGRKTGKFSAAGNIFAQIIFPFAAYRAWRPASSRR
jgi:hypothetical protein